MVVALEAVVCGMIQSVIHLTDRTMVEVVLVVPEAVALKEIHIVINSTMAEELAALAVAVFMALQVV
jgi:hypothetical protein